MAFIKIISIPGGGAATCTKYFYANGTALNKGCIKVGEVAEVPDSELAAHLATGKVMQVPGKESSEPPAPRRGRPPKVAEGFEAIFEAQRG